MEHIVLILGWIGIYSPIALGAIGSILGCSKAGQAAIGALLDVDSGYGRYIGVSAMPSSQTIYGIVVMLTLNRPVTVENSPGLFAIGVLVGIALLVSGIYQGKACASAIQVSKNKPEVFGISIAPAAIVEGFAVFAFVFALVLAGSV
ncbi:MAG: ATP synthase subunit C [Epsilonproteobacteria bacterium]|nr:ATP synthase subunit C [Campylobacterota bacterium]